MKPDEELDLDALRRAFAQRISGLIGDEKNHKNLDNFAKLTGVSMRQLSQWRNVKYPNWPDARSILRMCLRGNFSPTWLLLGKGHMKLSDISYREAALTALGITEELVDDMERLLQNHKPRPKQAIFEAVRRMKDSGETTNVADVSKVPDAATNKSPTRKVPRTPKSA